MKYEYLIKYDCDVSSLDSLGFEGWELVSTFYRAYGASYQTVFYFKRSLTSHN